jgi:cytochrome b561
MTMAQPRPFPLFSRILHWTMAAMVIAMLFIGIGMVSSVAEYHRLVSIHKPLGILILILVAIRRRRCQTGCRAGNGSRQSARMSCSMS